MKILFVENHAIFAQQVVSCFLSSHHVTIVPSLSAARVRLESENYDIPLVDYDLDDGKGDELVRELRESGRTTRILGVSAHEEGNTALLRAGADAICPKLEFNRIQELI